MFRPKFRIPWFIASVIAIPLVYFLAASVLLRPANTSILFTEQELDGLIEYKQALSLHIELCKLQRPEEIAKKINTIAENSRFTAWKVAKNSIDNLSADGLSMLEVATVLRKTIRDIGDESNLILDPVLESYYAVDILIDQIPLFLIWGTSNSKNMPMPEVVIHYSARLDHALDIISEHTDNNKQLAKNITDLKEDWGRITAKDYSVKSMDAMQQHVQSLAGTALEILSVLLNERLAEQKHQRLVIIWIVISFYLAITVLIAVAVRYYVSNREVILAKERQKLIAQLAQKNDELDKFAHAAAHDLKEPVRTIRCFATLLKSESTAELTSSSIGYVGVIENTAQRAEQMINDLLGYTKASEETLLIENCDCRKELLAVLEDLKSVIEPIKPDIIISALPVIRTVPSMFRRVMLNLIDNAIKYRSHRTSLTIEIGANNREANWIFFVRDNGMGLSNEHVESVFEPFRRLEPALHTEGSGIGLTSCRKIIERLGGKIWIASDLHKGTTVFFSLPS